MKDYGKDCDFLSKSESTQGLLTIAPSAMAAGVSYSFVVTVSSLDGRVARKTVIVNPKVSGGVQVSIANTIKTFNIGSKLVVLGFVTSGKAATSTWSVEDSSGLPVDFAPLTPRSKTFSATDVASKIGFPLSLRNGAFVGGGTYNFKLTTFPVDNPSLVSFSEMLMTANVLPTGGYVTSNPASGKAIVTQFLISTPGWTSDAANLPLIYSFSYCLAESAPYLTLAAASIRAFTTSTLPAGLSQLNDSITVRAKAADIFQSSAVAVTGVQVKIDKSVNLTQVATKALSEAFLSGNINLVYQTVNNVSNGGFSHRFSSPPCHLCGHKYLILMTGLHCFSVMW